jgi:AraC-like DNA-binding protein
LKLFIKYMVSSRCKTVVKEELKKFGLHFIIVDLGVVEIMETITPELREEIRIALHKSGLELMDDRKAVLIEKIKNAIIEAIHFSSELPKYSFSEYLSKKLDCDYTFLANQFSEVQGTTVEKFIITHKIERVKELLIYDELNLTEIAWNMRYSSVAHLSNQFKKITGLTPSQFKNLRAKGSETLV